MTYLYRGGHHYISVYDHIYICYTHASKSYYIRVKYIKCIIIYYTPPLLYTIRNNITFLHEPRNI